MSWDGDTYQERFDVLAAKGANVHGEADFVMKLRPRRVLDAGCGTGRVAIELARRGVTVVGADRDRSMVATAMKLAPDLAWHHKDLTTLNLNETFDVVVLAGNVPLFTPPGTHAALVAGCARHITPGGALITGFQIDERYPLEEFDTHAAIAGCDLTARYANWDGDPFRPDGAYAVSIHHRCP